MRQGGNCGRIDGNGPSRRLGRRGASVATLAVVALTTACGPRIPTPAAANDDIAEELLELPGARRIAVERYGYDLGDGRAAEDFFTEIEFAMQAATSPGDVLAAVSQRLGPAWEMGPARAGDGASEVTFSNGAARIELTTWDGGFDLTVASEGAALDGTPLAL